MVDINQGWNVNQAIAIGREMRQYGLFWLEDPTHHQDYEGLARIADALDTPIAAGEYHYGVAPFRHMLERRSIDIVMVDLLRVGGLTQWMKVGAHGGGLQSTGGEPPGAGGAGTRRGGRPPTG